MQVIIMRGVPGAGKSTYVRDNFPGSLVCSADDFFIGKDGVYRHDARKLGEAHQDCFRRFLAVVQGGRAEEIVVDNTGIRAWEIAPYVLAAETYGYTVKIITLVVNPKVAHERGIHGDSHDLRWYDKINQMAYELRVEKLPPWWNHKVI